jgi:small-conductance mechanosensitive channel
MTSANLARYGRSVKLSAKLVKVAGLSLSLAMLTAVVPLRAQTLPAFTPVSEVPAKLADGDSIPTRERALKLKLAEVSERLLALAPDDSAKPGGADASEWTEYKRLLNVLVNAYESHLDTLNKLRASRETHLDFQQKANAWAGFPESPPYSVEFVDDQWKQVRLKDLELESAQLELDMLQSMLETQRKAFQASGQNLRKVSELFEYAGPENSERERWVQELNSLRNQQDEARLAALDTAREVLSENLAYRRDERAFLQRKARMASRLSPFSQQERDQRIAKLAPLRQELDAEIAQTLTHLHATQQQVQQIREQQRLARARLTEMPAGADSLDREKPALQQALETANVETETAESNLRTLRLLVQATVARRQYWEFLYRIDNAGDLTKLEDISQEIQTGLQVLTLWRKYLRSDLDTARSRRDAQEKRLDSWQAEYGDRTLETRKLIAYTDQETMLKRGVTEADELEARFRSLSDSQQLLREGASVKERLRLFYTRGIELAGQLSDFELLTIEDKIVAEGREIVGKRSVTVGKVTQMLTIFGLGLWLIARLTEFGRSRVKHWQASRASKGLLGLRLFGLIAVVGIVVFALISVHIPLTVFTFLGGTLAIGVGFGAQNILNNFISGIILLMEGSIKIGDIVEVEGVLSRVTHIGSRCCQVHRFDGIDMLIPNSSFLEKSVTNWTLSDHYLRCSVSVGTAYGTPPGKAMALVERAAAEHAGVLKNPVPEVYLQDFGADALNLRLDFWVDLDVQSNRYRIMSDVRLQIEALFEQEGVEMAFPQRQLHLVHPLKVQLVATESATAEQADAKTDEQIPL